MKNIRSVILLAVLVSVLLFLVGFRLGKRIQRIDQTYTPSPTPPQNQNHSPTPTESPVLFNTYLNPECGITFLYPAALSETSISSSAAELKDHKQKIFVTCDRGGVSTIRAKVLDLEEREKATLSGQRIPIYQKDSDTTTWVVLNSKTGRHVAFEASANLTSLLLQTLEFVN